MENEFILESIYSELDYVFSSKKKSLADCKKTAEFTFDTNVLLRPYKIQPHDFKLITNLYKSLINENRMYLTARVVREFIKNRPIQLSNIHQKLQDHISLYTTPPMPTLPIFDGDKDYEELIQIAQQLDKKRKELISKTKSKLSQIEYWHEDDIVSSTYRDIFSNIPIVENIEEQTNLLTEWKRRLTNKIPPGYKDSNKGDSGIGDFLIWMSILHHARVKQIDTILVTDDGKADWWHRGSSGRTLFPRYEMVEEYRIASNGRTFHMVTLQEFLDLMGIEVHLPQENTKDQTGNFDDLSFRVVDIVHSAFSINQLNLHTIDYNQGICIISALNEREAQLLRGYAESTNERHKKGAFRIKSSEPFKPSNILDIKATFSGLIEDGKYWRAEFII